MYGSHCRWLLCLSQQLFQGLGTPSKTTAPANSCPLSEINPFVGPAWQQARRLLAPGTTAGPRAASHAGDAALHAMGQIQAGKIGPVRAPCTSQQKHRGVGMLSDRLLVPQALLFISMSQQGCQFFFIFCFLKQARKRRIVGRSRERSVDLFVFSQI